MQATRIRLHLGAAVEWVVAIAFLLCTLGVASLIVRELKTAPRAQPASKAAPATALPGRGARTRGFGAQPDAARRAADSRRRYPRPRGRDRELARSQRTTGGRSGALGERVTRFYDHQGTSFVVVFEPFERDGALRVAAIYPPEG